MNTISYKDIKDSRQFVLIAGPCVVEDEESPIMIAQQIKDMTQRLGIPFVFKASYRKANRSSVNSFTGIGDIKALKVLKNIGDTLNVPVITDIHEPEEAAMAAEYADILQIPAFLCRQTDLLEAAAKTGKIVNVKKGQFLSGEAMQFVVEKLRHFGNDQIMLTERGNMYGYGDLVVDYRNIAAMQKLGVPVILDATHSLQQPNQTSGVTGGQPHLISLIAKAGIAAGVDGIFVETHPDPSKAKSDGANMLPLNELEPLLIQLCKIHKALC